MAPADEAQSMLEEGKHNSAGKSQSVNCTMCDSALPHPMRYKILKCRSEACESENPGIACPWRSKVTTCSKLEVTSIYECGEHLSQTMDPSKRSLREAHKQYCRLMATEGLKPLRIRNGLRKKFALKTDEMPELSTVQNFVNNYVRTKLANHDRIKDIAAMVREKQNPHAVDDDNEPLTFTPPVGIDATTTVGNGSDSRPFIVGITTKKLLRNLQRPPSSFVFHVDATYKLSQVGYPVLVIGISDRCRTFHLVAFCIVSQTTEPVLTGALAALKRLYSEVTGSNIQLAHVMGDADDAQFNALFTVFGQSSNYQFLMCFFHVLLNVNKRLQAVPPETASTIRRDIYNMHFCASNEEFLRLADSAVNSWSALRDAPGFAAYFSKEWFSKKFFMWQCFRTQPGYATTNNLVEQFNRHIKQHYSLHLKLKTGTLLMALFQCVASESAADRPFRDSVEASSSLATRMRELARDGHLVESQLVQYSQDGIVAVMETPAKRVFVPSKKRTEEYLAVTAQLGVNYARMEVEGQPPIGWPVDVVHRTCGCRYWFKFGSCVHLLFAMQRSALVDAMGNEVLMNRSLTRKRSRATNSMSAGRPARNGPALCLE